MAAVVPVGAAAAALALDRSLARLPAPVQTVLRGLALKPAFAVCALLEAGRRIEEALEAGDVDSSRAGLAALVSRTTTELDEPLIAAAAIESLAENLTDSVVAPILAFVVGGLPAAYAYRAINTLDSMIGYHGSYEWLGKAAARLDDAVNLIPARVATLLLLASTTFRGQSPSGGLRALRRDRGRTPSPNAGWTMATAAGAMGVRLEKRGEYVLNPDGRIPTAADVHAARRLVATATALGLGLAGCAALCRILRSGR
jgi:adenosylcobinamide-phosphate synthase